MNRKEQIAYLEELLSADIKAMLQSEIMKRVTDSMSIAGTNNQKDTIMAAKHKSDQAHKLTELRIRKTRELLEELKKETFIV